jgi:hypothetical protein
MDFRSATGKPQSLSVPPKNRPRPFAEANPTKRGGQLNSTQITPTRVISVGWGRTDNGHIES